MDFDDERFNELEQFSAHDAEILKSLLEIGKVDEINVHHVDFDSGELIISIRAMEKTFDGVMDSIMFCAASKRMQVKSVDFDTGEIKIQWLPAMPWGMTAEEIAHIRAGKKIDAIKAVRKRTNMGLVDAKNFVEKHWEEIRQGSFR